MPLFSISAVIIDLPKMRKPFLDDLTAPGLDHIHNVAQCMGGDMGIVIAQVAPPGLGNPNLCGVRAGSAQADVNMDWFQRVIFI